MRPEQHLELALRQAERGGDGRHRQRILEVAPHQRGGLPERALRQDRHVGRGMRGAAAIEKQRRDVERQRRPVSSCDELQHEVERRRGAAATGPVSGR